MSPDVDPRLLKMFLDEVSAKSRRISEAIGRKIEAARRIAEFCRWYLKPLPPSETRRMGVVGVDGSFQVVGPSHLRLILAVAVLVRLLWRAEGVDVETMYTGYFVDVVHGINEDVVRGVAEDVMMFLETQSLERITDFGDGIAVFIDGPLMDPPRTLLEESAKLFEKMGCSEAHSRYHEWRAQVLSRAVKRGALLVGYVKRPGSDKLLLRVLNSCAEDYAELFESDDELTALMLVAQPELRNFFLGPIEYPQEHPLYEIYREKGLRIVTAYTIPPGRMRPVRVEVPVIMSNAEDAVIKALALVRTLTPQGLQHPLPVILAHERCSINKEAAKTMLRELVSRVLTSSRNPEVVGSALVEDLT